MNDPHDRSPLTSGPIRLDAWCAAKRRADIRRLWTDFIALLVLLSALFAAWLWADGWLP